MNGINAVLDTNLLIYRSKGLIDLKPLCAPYTHLYISVITEMETLGYTFSSPAEETQMRQIISAFPIIHTNTEIVNQVILYRKRKKIKLPDAIILATARYMNADLLTLNIGDFQHLDTDIRVIAPVL